MAKKKNDIDDFDFDQDFEELSFPGDDSHKSKKKDRNPVSEIKSSFTKGAREQFTKPQTIRRLAKAALPKEYKSVFEASDVITKEGSELYNSAIKELKPALPQLKRATQSVLPRVRRFLPDKIAKKLDELTQPESKYVGRSQEEEDDSTIHGALGDIFKLQMESQAQQREEDKAEKRIRQRISDDRQLSTMKQLTAIRSGMERLTAYQDQVTSKYQQKSLELQYRHYFATRDLLKLSIENAARDREHQEALLKNTSLPEYAKIRLSEVNHQMLRDRLLGRIQGALGSSLSRMGARLIKTAKENIQGTLGGFAAGVQAAGDMRDMMADMGISPTQMLGEQVGSMFANSVAQRVGQLFAPMIRKVPGLAGAGARAGYMLNTATEQLRSYAKNNQDKQGLNGFFARLLSDAMPSLNRSKETLDSMALRDADKPAQYDNLSRRSLVEIIPGYLSRIHQELASIRAGKPVDRITFNLDRGRFTTAKDAAKSAYKGTMDGNALLNAREDVTRFTSKIVGNAKVSPDFLKRLNKQFYEDTINGRQFVLDRYIDDSELRHLTKKDKEFFRKNLAGQFTGKNGRPDYSRLADVSRDFNKLHASVVDPTEIIKARLENGQLQELLDSNLVVEDPETGELIVNMDYIDEQAMAGDIELSPREMNEREEKRKKALKDQRRAAAQARLLRRKAGKAANRVKQKASDFADTHLSPDTQRLLKVRAKQAKKKGRSALNALSEHASSANDYVRDTTVGKALRGLRVKAKRKLRDFSRGYASGGYTGDGDKFDEAGIVHRGEVVWSQENVEQAGGPEVVEALRRKGLQALSRLARARREGKKIARDKLNSLDGVIQAIYVAGSEEPVLDPIKLKAGLYHDVRTGQVLKSIYDIRGPVADETGTVVLSSEMIARDLYDAAGRKLNTLSKRAQEGAAALKRRAQEELAKRGGVVGITKKAHAFAKRQYEASKKTIGDIYTELGGDARLEAIKLQAGEYRDQATGKIIQSYKDIKGPVIDKAGNVVLSAKDLAGRLFDKDGKVLHDIGQQAREGMNRAAKGVRGLALGLLGGQPSGSAGSGGGGSDGNDPATSAAYDEYRNKRMEQEEHKIALLEGILDSVSGQVSEGPAPAKRGVLRRGVGWLGGSLRRGIGLLGRATAFTGRGVGGLISNVGRGLYSLSTSGLSGIIGGAEAALTDIYVKGRSEPALYASKMRNGDYLDKNTGKPVRSIKDIKGAVLDEQGNVVLTEEEYASGMYNSRGRKIVGAIVGAAGAVLRGYAGFLGGSANLLFAGINGALRVATNLISSATENKAVDVYVKDDLKTPRLRAVIMKAGGYRLIKDGKPGKVIQGWRDVKGAVIDAEGNIVLSEEEYQKGIVDRSGKPFGGPGALGKIGGALLGGAGGLVATVAKTYFNVAKSLVSLTGDAASWGIRSIGSMFGLLSPKHIVQTDAKIVQYLHSINEILDQRLPATKKVRKGSFEDRLAEEAAKDKERAAEHDKQEAAKAARSGGLLSGLAKLFKGKGDDSDEDDDGGSGGNTYIMGGSDADAKRRDRRNRAKERLKARKKAARRKGRFGALFRAKDKVGGSLGKLGRKLKPKKAGRIGRALGRFRPRGGGIGGVAAGLAMGLGGDWLLDKTLGKKGKAREAADTALNVASTASMLGAMVPGVASAAGAVASGAAAVGSGILAVLSAPVVLGALAVGALAYGGYKLYKKFKYGKSGPMRTYRLMQYGVDPTETSQAEPVIKLEIMLADRVKGSGETAAIDLKGINPDDIFDLFDLDEGWFTSKEKTAKRRLQWISWFDKRFKPIFCSWVMALKQQDKAIDLQDIDSKLPGSKKLKLLDAVKSFGGLYAFTTGPFYDKTPITDAEKINAAETAARNAATEEAKKETAQSGEKAKVEEPKAAATATAVAGATTAAAATQANKAKANATAAETKAAVAATAPQGPSVASNLGLMAGALLTGPIGFVAGMVALSTLNQGNSGRSLTALEAVRYRTYGLTDLTGDRVATLTALERAVFKQLTFDQSGQAKYTGDIGTLMQSTAGAFGVSLNDPLATARWMRWMTGRFLPTVIAYASAVKRASTTAKLEDADRSLKPEQALTVAREVVAAKDSSGASVWELVVSPWSANETLNRDANSTYASVLILDEASKKTKPISEPSLPGQKGQQAIAQAKKDVANGTPAGTKSWAEKLKETMGGDSIFTRGMSSLAGAYLAGAKGLWDGAKRLANGAVDVGDKIAGAMGGPVESFWSDVKSTGNAVIGAIGGGATMAAKAAEYATKSAGTKSVGKCAKYVADALEKAGYRFQRQASAYMYASKGVLASMGFTRIPEGTPPKVGDVIVIAANEKHPHGHIQIFNGKNWVSDFVQNGISPYRDPMPYTMWRDQRGGLVGAVKDAVQGAYGVNVGAVGNGTGGRIDQIPMPTGEGSWSAVKDTIIAAAKMVGVSPALMATMAGIESGFRPGVSAKTSSAAGLYQFIRSTWDAMLKQYGSKYGIDPNTPPTDPRASALMGAEYIRENAEAISKALGRPATDTELYLAHFMGRGGAIGMLKAAMVNPTANAASMFPAAAKANKSIFFNGDQPRSVAQVIQDIDSRVSKHRIDVGSSVAVTANPVGTSKTGTAAPPAAAPGATPAKPTPTVSSVATTAPSGPAGPKTLPSAPSTALPVPSITDRRSTQAIAERGGGDAQEQQARVGAATAVDIRSRQVNDSNRQFDALAGIMTEQLTVQREMASYLQRAVAKLDALSKLPGSAVASQATTSSPASPPTPKKAPQPMVNVGRKVNWA